MEINLSEIYEGWKNLVFKNKKIEALAISRLLICGQCEVRTEGYCDKVKGGCGCPLKAKTRSPKSKCPLKKW